MNVLSAQSANNQVNDKAYFHLKSGIIGKQMNRVYIQFNNNSTPVVKSLIIVKKMTAALPRKKEQIQ